MELGDLAPGAWRELSEEEHRTLLVAAHAGDNT